MRQHVDLGALEVAVRNRCSLSRGAFFSGVSTRMPPTISVYKPTAFAVPGLRMPVAGRRLSRARSGRYAKPARITIARPAATASSREIRPGGSKTTPCRPAVQRMSALAGALVSFEGGSLLLKELAAVELPAKRM